MSILHGDVEGFSDGVSDRVMWGLFVKRDGVWQLVELAILLSSCISHSSEYEALTQPTIIQAVKVRVDLRGAQ